MKKIGLILLAFLFIFGKCKQEDPNNDQEQAHFIVKSVNGSQLDDGVQFTFTTTDATSDLQLLVENTSDKEIKLKTKLVDVGGTDGSEMEFCFGSCYLGMNPNTAYPVNSDYGVDAHQTTQQGDIHYHNHFTGSCSYKIQIYEVDDHGAKVGKAFTFRYIKN